MPKSKKCRESNSNSNYIKNCVKNSIQNCKLAYCNSKYEKLANKLLATGLIQDSCNYNADRLADTVAGSKWQWLNTFLINSSSAPNVTELVPASYGSIASFQAVEPSLSDYVFAIKYTDDNNSLLNNTIFNAGLGVPILQDIFEYYYSVNSLTAPPLNSTIVFGTSTLNEMLSATIPASPPNNGEPNLAVYIQGYINAINQIINQLPIAQLLALNNSNQPLVVSVSYTENSPIDGSIVNKVATVGIILVDSSYIIYGYCRNDCPPLSLSI
jgi:hypothetical protein